MRYSILDAKLSYTDNPEFHKAESAKQDTSPSVHVVHTRELGTGCSSEASGATEDEGLDAAPLGHKIEDGNLFCKAPFECRCNRVYGCVISICDYAANK